MSKIIYILSAMYGKYKYIAVLVVCMIPSVALSESVEASAAQLQKIMNGINLSPEQLKEMSNMMKQQGKELSVNLGDLTKISSEMAKALSGNNASAAEQQKMINETVSKVSKTYGVSPAQLREMSQMMDPAQLQKLQQSMPDLNRALQQLSKPK